MGSSSRASTTTAQTTNQVSRNLNLQDTEGVTVGEAGGDVTIVSTDHNAFADASDLARRSLDVGETISRDALNLSLQQTREVARGFSEFAGTAEAFGDKAFGTVERALGEVSGAYQDSAAYQKAALQEVSTSAGSFFDKALSFASNLASKSSETLSGTVSALQDISVEQNKSTDQRLQESTERMLKYTLIGFGVLVVGFLGFTFVRGRS